MQEACPAGEGSMAALIGLEPKVVDEICAQASSGGQFAVPANLNAPGQIVIAGHTEAVRHAIELAKQRGSKMSVELNVSAPFHCALMQPARDGMRAVLEKLAVRPLRFGVIANVTGAVNRNHRRVVPLLLEQITAPVRWEESMASLAAQGADAAIEIGCGRVLSGLMRRINKSLKTYPLEDLASLNALQAATAGG
jgi:[acyl-carrier-protein] S-malonyltransferase